MSDDQVFRFMAWAWNIGTAEHVVERDGNELIRVTVEPLARMAGMIRTDAEHAKTVDLERPVLIIDMGEGGHMLIDGWHRLRRATDEGVETLPAYLLTAEQERECRDPRTMHESLDRMIAGSTADA